MKVICPSCGQTVPAENVALDKSWGRRSRGRRTRQSHVRRPFKLIMVRLTRLARLTPRHALYDRTRAWRVVRACVLLLTLGIVSCPSCLTYVRPLRARQNAILLRLKATASDVSAYREVHGELPASRTGTLLPNETYRLVAVGDGSSFLVVADRVFVDENGSRFNFACDEKLQIRKIPLPSRGEDV